MNFRQLERTIDAIKALRDARDALSCIPGEWSVEAMDLIDVMIGSGKHDIEKHLHTKPE